ncbi:FtsX-like permease family protein [Microbacterium sp.]|uniref:FtsX-like permease family protein n=1 Tax=Microbacterium sp. TaxID=51671 RepID=UPI003F9716E6
MLNTVIADLRSKTSLWLPAMVAFVVGASCAGGVATAISTGLQTASAAPGADALEGVRVLGGMIGVLTILAAAGVIGSTAGFVLSAQSKDHALWLIVGFTPRQLRQTLRLEIFSLSLIAGVIAVPLSYAIAAGVLWQWSTIDIIAAGQGPIFEFWQPLAVLFLAVVSVAWGTWGLTRRAARIPEMAALREARASRPHVGWMKTALAVLLFSCGFTIILAVTSSRLGGPDDRAAGALSALLVLILATLLVPAWTIRPLLWTWTAFVPSRSNAWHLARETCRFASTRSLATVVPFAITSSVLAVLHGGGAISGGGTTLAEVGVLIGPTLLIAWAGGVCVIALIGRSRSRDHELLEAAGAPPGLILRIACLEGAIYAATALLYGLIFLVAAMILLSAVADIVLTSALIALPWGTFAALAVLTLATSIAAVLLSASRRDRRRGA